MLNNKDKEDTTATLEASQPCRGNRQAKNRVYRAKRGGVYWVETYGIRLFNNLIIQSCVGNAFGLGVTLSSLGSLTSQSIAVTQPLGTCDKYSPYCQIWGTSTSYN